MGFESLAILLVCGWFLKRGKVAVAAALLIVSLSHIAAFVMAEYGPSSAAPALLLPTIIISGLVIGGYFLGGWTATCAFLLLWISAPISNTDWPLILFWCATYAATAYLTWLFSSHLENLLAASRRAEEDRREAVVEERTRLAREIHDTLAQGFTGIVVQINAAEQIAAEKNREVWSHLERARALARQSLEEARRSILALRSSGPEQPDLLRAIEGTARQLLVDESVQLEAVREGEACDLPSEVESELLRVGQEAVTNAIRHSDASKIRLLLQYLPHRVTLRVADNGNGLAANSRGLGIQGMEERMRRIEGDFEIVAQEGVGTTVVAAVTV
jgi:signal transduction histidine kinase